MPSHYHLPLLLLRHEVQHGPVSILDLTQRDGRSLCYAAHDAAALR